MRRVLAKFALRLSLLTGLLVLLPWGWSCFREERVSWQRARVQMRMGIASGELVIAQAAAVPTEPDWPAWFDWETRTSFGTWALRDELETMRFAPDGPVAERDFPLGICAQWCRALGAADRWSVAIPLRPFWILAALPLAVRPVRRAWEHVRRYRRLRRGRCTCCGYDLTANVSGTCPECGTPVNNTSTDDAHRSTGEPEARVLRPRWFRLRQIVVWALICVILSGGLCALWQVHDPQRTIPRPQWPRLFREQTLDCAAIAEAVNHYVDLGQADAAEELRELARAVPDDRFSWVCRILFDPKGSVPLREPWYGALNLPYQSMPPKDWAKFPLAHSGSTYFVLANAYLVGGHPEQPDQYLNFCIEYGVFRKMHVPVPNRQQALDDAEVLRNSAAWKAANWRWPQEEDTWSYVQRQAAHTPP